MCFRIKYLFLLYFLTVILILSEENWTNETNRTNRWMNNKKRADHLCRIKNTLMNFLCINFWVKIVLLALHPCLRFEWLFTLDVQIEKFVCLTLWFTPRKIVSLISKDLNVWLQDYPLDWGKHLTTVFNVPYDERRANMKI
jgi:hypothetical protein